MFLTYSLYNLLILIVIYTGSLCNSDVKDSNVIIAPGLIFDRIGNSKFIKGFLDLHIDLRCSSEINIQLNSALTHLLYINDTFMPFIRTQIIHANFHRIAHSIHKTNEHDMETNYVNRQINSYTQQLDILQKHALFSITKLNLLLKNPWIKHYNNDTLRSKRGLLDIGGHLLRSLFGTAMDADVQVIHKQVNLLSQNSNNMYTLFIKYKQQMEHNTHAIQKLTDALKHIQYHVQDLHIFSSLMNSISLISSYFSLLDTYLYDINYIQDKVLSAYNLAHKRITSHSLYSYSFMETILQEKKYYEHINFQTIIPLSEESFHSFLSYTWSILDIYHYSIVTIIPFVSSNIEDNFYAYKLTPFPTHFRNQRIIFYPKEQIFFVTKKGMKYSYLSNIQLTHCLHVFNTSVCPLLNPVITFTNPNCELFLYTNNSFIGINKELHCNHIVYSNQKPYTVSIHNKLFISIFNKLDGQLSCRTEMINKDITIENIYILNPGCTLTTTQYTFVNPHHILKSSKYLESTNVYNLPITFTFDNHSFDTSNFFKKLPNLYWDKNLDNLNSSIMDHNFHLAYLPYTTYISAPVLCIIVIIVIVILWRMYGRRRVTVMHGQKNSSTLAPYFISPPILSNLNMNTSSIPTHIDQRPTIPISNSLQTFINQTRQEDRLNSLEEANRMSSTSNVVKECPPITVETSI